MAYFWSWVLTGLAAGGWQDYQKFSSLVRRSGQNHKQQGLIPAVCDLKSLVFILCVSTTQFNSNHRKVTVVKLLTPKFSNIHTQALQARFREKSLTSLTG